jgi:hypothetical protein
MKKYDHIIAIDPDVDKSGVAYLVPKTRKLSVKDYTFPVLLDYLQGAKRTIDKKNESLIVVVEAGWLSKANWHLRRYDNIRVASAKGNSTGRNHEVGRKIVEMCQHYELEVLEHFPLRKTWKGADGKITREELAYFTGFNKRSNQEMRDAALLAWAFAGLPIRAKC